MAKEYSHRILRIPDRILIDKFLELKNYIDFDTVAVNVAGRIGLGSIDLSNHENESLQKVLNHNSFLISGIYFSYSQSNIHYHRGGRDSENKSPFYDEISIDMPNGRGDDSLIAVVAALQKCFPPISLIEGSGDDSVAEQLRAMQQSAIDDFRYLNAELYKFGVEYRKEIDKEIKLKNEGLEEDFKVRRAELECELSLRAEKLNEQQSLLDEQRKSLDDRDNTHARRAIRDRMLDDVKQRIEQFGVSRSTSIKRWPVLIGMLMLGLILAGLLAATIHDLSSFETALQHAVDPREGFDRKLTSEAIASLFPTSQRWWLWIRTALLAFALVATILYYIKWENAWANRHAEAELGLQQFYIDVNRANWVVESCLEWRKETSSEIPTDLLKSIARGLFESSQQQTEQVIHPADELASAILGSSSKVKINAGNSEIEIDKPGKKLGGALRLQGAEKADAS